VRVIYIPLYITVQQKQGISERGKLSVVVGEMEFAILSRKIKSSFRESHVRDFNFVASSRRGSPYEPHNIYFVNQLKDE
jgi:hypothetical protein